MMKTVDLQTLSNMLVADRKNGITNYKLINKYVGVLPTVVQIKGGQTK